MIIKLKLVEIKKTIKHDSKLMVSNATNLS